MMTVMDTTDALQSWGSFDRDNPFPLFADVREQGPVHAITLADGHAAWLVVGIRRGQAHAERHATVEGHAGRVRER